jgi:hypothetical protein
MIAIKKMISGFWEMGPRSPGILVLVGFLGSETGKTKMLTDVAVVTDN